MIRVTMIRVTKMAELLTYARILDGEILVEALGLALLHSLWQGVLIGLAFKAVMAALANASAALRYWCGVSALLLLAMSVPLTMVYLAADMLPAGVSTGAFAAGADMLVATVAGTAAEGFTFEAIVALWIAGVTVISIRTLAAWRHLGGLRRAADKQAALLLVPVVERLSGLFGLARRVDIGLSASISNPMVVGWLKPVILMPPAILTQLPLAQLEMLIAHELAHLRRHDHWINLFQVVTETLMFYHPVVTMISRQIRIERENACDDLAVTVTRRRLDYVEMLASLENSRRPGRALALGIQDGQVLARIRRLVELREPRAGRGTVLPALIALLGVSALLAMPLIDDVIPRHQTLEPAAIDLAGTGDQSGATELEPPAAVRLAAFGPAAPPLNVFEAVETPADEPTPSLTEMHTETGQPHRGAIAEDQEAPGEPSAAPGSDRGAGSDAIISNPSSSSEQGLASDVGRTDDETRSAEAPAERTLAASGNSPARARKAGQNDTRPQEADAEQAPDSRPIETPRLDLAMLLARRSDPLDASPTEWGEPDAVTGPARARPKQARSASGDARQPTKLMLAGGELLRKIDPAYPQRALRRAIQGRVKMEFQIGRTGRVVDIEILDETPKRAGFGAAARDAVRRWKFEPFMHDGTPVVQRKVMVFNFKPGDGCQPVTGSRLLSC